MQVKYLDLLSQRTARIFILEKKQDSEQTPGHPGVQFLSVAQKIKFPFWRHLMVFSDMQGNFDNIIKDIWNFI